MEEHIEFESDGLTLDGILHIPDDYKPGEKRAAMLILHGFGGSKNGGGAKMQAEFHGRQSSRYKGHSKGTDWLPS